MHGKANDGGAGQRFLKDQGVVLSYALERHPEPVFVERIANDLSGGDWDRYSPEWWRFEQAALVLVHKHLLFRRGEEMIRVSPETLYFSEILDAGGFA